MRIPLLIISTVILVRSLLWMRTIFRQNAAEMRIQITDKRMKKLDVVDITENNVRIIRKEPHNEHLTD